MTDQMSSPLNYNKHTPMLRGASVYALRRLFGKAEAGYPYIVGYHKRGRVVSDALLESYADVKSYAKLKDNLYYLKVPAAGIDDEDKNKDNARYILCYNPVKAVQDKAFRETAMEEAKKALSELQQRLVKPKRGRKPDPKRTMVKVAEILTKKCMQAFFGIDFDG